MIWFLARIKSHRRTPTQRDAIVDNNSDMIPDLFCSVFIYPMLCLSCWSEITYWNDGEGDITLYRKIRSNICKTKGYVVLFTWKALSCRHRIDLNQNVEQAGGVCGGDQNLLFHKPIATMTLQITLFGIRAKGTGLCFFVSRHTVTGRIPVPVAQRLGLVCHGLDLPDL